MRDRVQIWIDRDTYNNLRRYLDVNGEQIEDNPLMTALGIALDDAYTNSANYEWNEIPPRTLDETSAR